jgi:hypothetical protein
MAKKYFIKMCSSLADTIRRHNRVRTWGSSKQIRETASMRPQILELKSIFKPRIKQCVKDEIESIVCMKILYMMHISS